MSNTDTKKLSEVSQPVYTVRKPIYHVTLYHGLSGASDLEREIFDHLRQYEDKYMTYDRVMSVKRKIMDIHDRHFLEFPRCKKDKGCQYEIRRSHFDNTLTIKLGERQDAAEIRFGEILEILDYEGGFFQRNVLPRKED